MAPPALLKNLNYQPSADPASGEGKNEINYENIKMFHLGGIYLFSSGENSYLGSSKDLFKRCFTQHKNNAFTQTSKHSKFYNNVVTNSSCLWRGRSIFTLYILDLTPNHIEIFAKLNPNHIITKTEYNYLQDLTLYELTIAEQIYMDIIQPSLNSNIYAN